MLLDWIRNGHQRFLGGSFNRDKPLYEKLAREGQDPRLLVITCADSRFDPVVLLDAHPGDIFMLRNPGNIVPPFDSEVLTVASAIEFAFATTKIEAIAIIGHSQCGAMNALRTGGVEHEGPLKTWLSLAEEACSCLAHKDPQEDQVAIEFENIRMGLKNLQTYPGVADRIKDGTLTLHGFHFDIETGNLSRLVPETGEFEVFSRRG